MIIMTIFSTLVIIMIIFSTLVIIMNVGSDVDGGVHCLVASQRRAFTGNQFPHHRHRAQLGEPLYWRLRLRGVQGEKHFAS